ARRAADGASGRASRGGAGGRSALGRARRATCEDRKWPLDRIGRVRRCATRDRTRGAGAFSGGREASRKETDAPMIARSRRSEGKSPHSRSIVLHDDDGSIFECTTRLLKHIGQAL